MRNPGRSTGVFVRFGEWHPSETSRNYALGRTEKGVSVYEAAQVGGKVRVKVPDNLEWSEADFHRRMNDIQKALDEGGDAPLVFLVTGNVVGQGHDGEPLLKHVSVVRELSLSEISW